MTFIEDLMHFLTSFTGSYGILGFFISMILQAVVAPIPGEVVMMAGGAIFGLLVASIVGEIAGCIGASLCFFISRKGGRALVMRIIGKKGLDFADDWFKKYGLWAVFFARLIPLVPVDAVSYGAGLTAMSFKSFIIATIVGMLPRVIFYSYLGELAAEHIETIGLEKVYFNILLIVVLIAVVIMACIYLFKKMQMNRKEHLKI